MRIIYPSTLCIQSHCSVYASWTNEEHNRIIIERIAFLYQTQQDKNHVTNVASCLSQHMDKNKLMTTESVFKDQGSYKEHKPKKDQRRNKSF